MSFFFSCPSLAAPICGAALPSAGADPFLILGGEGPPGAPLLAFFEKGPLDEQVLLGVGSISAAHVDGQTVG